jgi:hypothetical protein
MYFIYLKMALVPFILILVKAAVAHVLLLGGKESDMSHMYVSLRSVQRICLEGQKGEGIHVVVNKKVNHCGRKRIEISPESIATCHNPVGRRPCKCVWPVGRGGKAHVRTM